MTDDIANVVHPVFNYGLRLKERVARGEATDMETEQATLKGLLLGEMEARRVADYGGDRSIDMSTMGGRTLDPSRRSSESFLGIRYALACWLDDVGYVRRPLLIEAAGASRVGPVALLLVEVALAESELGVAHVELQDVGVVDTRVDRHGSR